MKRDEDMGHDANGRGNGNGNVLRLIRETADGLGHLVVQHLKLAQLELTANLRAMASRLGLVAVLGVVMVAGYTLTMAGVAFLLTGNRPLAFAFGGVGLAHVVGTGVGMFVLVSRIRRTAMMPASTGELTQTATTLMEAAKEAPASSASPQNRLEQVDAR